MKRIRNVLLVMAVGTLGLLGPGFTPDADAAGGLECTLNGFVVKDPTPLAEPGGGTNGSGFFGAAKAGTNTVPSNVECAGSINGVATVGGSFVWCQQDTDHDASTNGYDPDNNPSTPDPDPTDFNCNGASGHSTDDEALYPGEVAGDSHPTNVHVVGSGTLDGTPSAWLTPAGTPATDICQFKFEGHALAPVRLDVTITCGSQTFTGVATANVVPILGIAGDSFGPAGSEANPPLCADTLGPFRPDCFRAVVFNGSITAADTNV